MFWGEIYLLSVLKFKAGKDMCSIIKMITTWDADGTLLNAHNRLWISADSTLTLVSPDHINVWNFPVLIFCEHEWNVQSRQRIKVYLCKNFFSFLCNLMSYSDYVTPQNYDIVNFWMVFQLHRYIMFWCNHNIFFTILTSD